MEHGWKKQERNARILKYRLSKYVHLKDLRMNLIKLWI